MNRLTTYNERTWAIDLVSSITAYTHHTKLVIRRADGERTVKENTGASLFPDVMLYGDGGLILQGWELKLPNTPIHDPELIENATRKAKILGVDSFLLWNVDEAVLYVSDGSGGFDILHTWPPLGVASRSEVEAARDLWVARLHEILDALNTFFRNGTLSPSNAYRVLGDDRFMAAFVDQYAPVAAAGIEEACSNVASKQATLESWWRLAAHEYGANPTSTLDYKVVSRVAITAWVNRFVFCHFLKRFHLKAEDVEVIDENTSIADAVGIFAAITDECDFLQLFQRQHGDEDIGEQAWLGLCRFNRFLTSLDLNQIDATSLHAVQEALISASRRKGAGQYTTPPKLARLLVRIAMDQRAQHALDPCCGTGTIARAIYDTKRALGNQSPSDSLATTWASDLFQFPLQLCTVAMADPEAIGEPVQIFQRDVFELNTGDDVPFVNPTSGQTETRSLPLFQTIVSNLPFVRGEDFDTFNPAAREGVASAHGLSGRSDLFAYIVFHLERLLANNGRIGIIVSNAWLGTAWGAQFREALKGKLRIRTVVTSRQGRWFDNAKVVTNIIIMERGTPSAEDVITFAVTQKGIGDWTEQDVTDMANTLLVGSQHTNAVPDTLEVFPQTLSDIEQVEQMCGTWSPLFSDVRWLSSISHRLRPAREILHIARGSRRGWDAMFYPPPGHGIEPAYIRPVLKSMKTVNHLVAAPDSEAFCCNVSKSNLQQRGDTGALAWIKRFERSHNGSGRPLPQVLRMANRHWYEMSPDELADFVIGMNPEDRLFVAQMQQKGFVNQRLIRLTAHNASTDVGLLHALLNTSLGLFQIEAAGFGRGMGALDLSSDRMKAYLNVLDPDALSPRDRSAILSAFSPIKARPVLPLPDELASSDRIHFDQVVLDAYGFGYLADPIRTGLLSLYRIRKSVKD